MKHVLEKLPYGYNSLEPFIDEETMRIHHTKHHQAYIDKLNLALEKHPEFQAMDVKEIIKNIEKIPEEIRKAVINNAGGHLNHKFFWNILKKNVEPAGNVFGMIEKDFGSFEKFKEQFKSASLSLFGSGWTWLVVDEKDVKKGKMRLGIITTANQDNPNSIGKIPILALDLWEHAYYLKYRNDRAGYIDAFFNVIDWNKAGDNFRHVK